MKKLMGFIIIAVMLIVSSHPSWAADKKAKSQFVQILERVKSKLGKDSKENRDNGVTIVAGVRGDNVYEQNKNELKKDLYWEH